MNPDVRTEAERLRIEDLMRQAERWRRHHARPTPRRPLARDEER